MEGYHQQQQQQQQQEDSSYNSTSENELESDTEDDPEKLLNAWLGELNSLTGGLDSVAPCAMRPLNSHLNTPRIDSYRFSMANLEDSQETELDAILGELCALETQCDQALSANAANRRQHLQTKPTSTAGEGQPVRSCPQQQQTQHRMTHSRSSSEGTRAKPDGEDGSRDHVVRTDSPDNDSAFSDNVSMLSSESSASSGGSGGRVVGAPGAADPGKAGQPVSPTSQMDVASRAKAEKIKIALEKMREASVKKLFIKAFGGDGSSKSLLVDEAMTAGHVARLLADKNHTAMDPCWAVVEHLPELHMERAYEDHELLVENLLMWTRDSKNKLLFVERPEKVALFTGPELFLLPPGQRGGSQADFDDHARTLLLEEFFSGGAGVPEVEGPLYLKSDSKKGWKRHHFVLRASGLYYLPKEKARSGGGGSSARDLAHLASFDVNQVYYGVGWRKKYKAPTDFCFAIKHPRLQQPKSTKYIKFLCAEDEAALHRWVVGIRLAKFGRQLMDNYRALVDELAQDDLDQLAQARSCSVSSIAPALAAGGGGVRSAGGGGAASPSDSPGGGAGTAADAVSTSSSSSGCLSDGCCGSATGSGGTASTLSGNTAAAGFECDFPTTGTIKRKPSVNPKLPLTSITRQLKEVGETVACSPSTPSPSTAATTPTSVFSPSADLVDSVNVNMGTIQRAGSVRRRRSCQTPSTPDSGGGGGGTDSGSNSSTLKRHHSIGGGSARGSASASSSSSSTPVREPPPPLPVPAEPEVEEELPPPPPDMFESTLSLDSLPPPPPPQPAELSGSQLSLASLPPPPPPYRPPPPAPTPPSGTSTPTDCLSPTRRGPLATPPPVYSAPPYLAELKAAGGGPCGQPGSPLVGRRPRSPPPSTPPPVPPPSQAAAAPQSPVLLTKTQQRSRTTGKKISFAIPAESSGADGTRSLPPPASRKPPPPRRSESTRLTTLPAPQQLAPPPKDFLKDLQRVMKKKWQVAQKCKADLSMTPHEVLGFRDAPPPPLPPPDVRRENSVLDWVQEHYGGGGAPHQYNLYENVYLVGGGGSPAHAPPPGPPAVNGQHYPPYHQHDRHLDGTPSLTAVDYRAGPAPGSRLSRQNSVAAAIAAKKRPPPPPPKRAETTQLTTTAVPPHARAPLPPPPPPHPSR